MNTNIGLSYRYKDTANIDLSLVKGNSLNLSFSIGFSGSKNYRKKPKVFKKTYHRTRLLISNKSNPEITYFFIVERMTAFAICIDHSKLRPAHEYSSKLEVYRETSGDIPA